MRELLRRPALIRSLSTSSACASPLKLHRYQEEAVQACKDALAAGRTRIGVSLPTGSGKTIVFLTLLSRIKPPAHNPTAKGALVIVNNIELVRQTVGQARRLFPEWTIAIDQGPNRPASTNVDLCVVEDVQFVDPYMKTICSIVATPQTLSKPERLSAYDPHMLKAIVVDEAHHAAAPSFRAILSKYHPEIAPPSDVPLVPAPCPLSQSSVSLRHGCVWTALVSALYSNASCTNALFWTWSERVVCVGINLKAVRIDERTGDLNVGTLAQIMDTPEMNRFIVKTWKEKAGHRKSTLVFCIDRTHLRALTDEFRAAGVHAEYLDRGTDPVRRRLLLDAFRQGTLQVLLNVQILMEGADVSNIDCIVLARPTQSQTLLMQMIGRGTRHSPATGKEDCHIIDFTDTAKRAGGLKLAPSLFGIDPPDIVSHNRKEVKQSYNRDYEGRQRPEKLRLVDHSDIFTYADAVPGIREYSPFAWVDCGDGLYILRIGYLFMYVQAHSEDGDARYKVWKTHIHPWLGRPTATLCFETDTLRTAMEWSHYHIKSQLGRSQKQIKSLYMTASWRYLPASEEQRRHLATLMHQNGLDMKIPGSLTQGQAQELIIQLEYAPLLRRKRLPSNELVL